MSAAASNRLLDAALEIQSFCQARHWRFCFIGGIAVQHWGEARLTRDADLTAFTGIGDEASYVDELLAHFAARMGDANDGAGKERSPAPARDHAIGASYRGRAALSRDRKRVDFKSGGVPTGDKDRYGVIAGREYLVARGIDCGGKIGGERYLRPAADQLYLAGFLQPLLMTGNAMQITVHL